jgi:4-amino-4-deoxy-L-arabinose transferase-like glycosyltransferase
MSNTPAHTTIHPQALSLQALRLLLLLAVAFSFYLNIYAVPLFDVDEGAFSEATREMFVRGDFISTYLDGQPRYDKPILIYWLQAASMFVFGVNEFAFRLPSALAATLWVLAVFAFVRRVKDEGTAFTAAIITATALEVSIMGKAATADALLNLFIASSMFCVYLYWREQERRWLLWAFACIGLGFLTKGPVAVLVPLAVSFLFYASRREFKAWFKAVFHPAGIGLFLLIAMPWYVVQYLKEGDAFIQGFFFKHNIDRFESSMEQHGGGLFYYIPVVLVAVLPFTSVLLKALSRIRLLWGDDLTRFCLLWFLFVLGFFSLSGTKLPHYVLYGMTGSFVFMALTLPQLHARLWSFLPQLILFTVLLLLPEVIEGLLPGIKDPYQHAMLADYKDYFSSGYRLFFVAAIMFTVYCMAERRFVLGDKLLASGVVSVLGVSLFVLPAVGGIQQGPIKAAALFAKRENLKVVRWRISTPSFSVYRQQVTENRLPRPGEVVLTTNKHLDEIGPYVILFRKAGVVLARSTSD